MLAYSTLVVCWGMQDTNNLRVAEVARALAVRVYSATAAFPGSESYGLTNQMRRAAVSIGSNIAEGCGRRSNRELLQFLFVAMGSASELQFQCAVAADLGMGDQDSLDATLTEVVRLKSMLARLITALRRQPARKPNEQPARARSLSS
jgi:four helix bundle protein